MKMFTEKKIWQKFLIAIVIIMLLFQFMIPAKSYAGEIKEAIVDAAKEIGSNILLGTARVTAAIGDLIMSAMNNFMLGTEGFGTAMISQEALNAEANGKHSWFYTDYKPKEKSGNADVTITKEDDNTIVYVSDDYIEPEPAFAESGEWEIPNLLYCPENIFGNKISMLDVNFLNPNTYTSVIESGRGYDKANERSKSIGEDLKETVANWYKAFRNIAIVLLLSILVYLGIRILISSTAEDKAKYKEVIKDWLIALVLVFVMHFIMSATIMIVNQVNSLFIKINNNVYITTGGVTFKTNFIGVMRFLAQSKDKADAWAYTIIYMVLVFYTISFTIQYLKRVLYIAFYTMISPLVAITYPMDKLGDGRSQAFNTWFKEYLMTMALQPIHLIIYTMIITSAMTLSIKSPLYAIVAIGFLIPAEQFIKSLFGVQSKADSGFGGFASGALAMKALDVLKRPIKNQNKNDNRISDNKDKEEDSKIRQINNKELESFKDNKQKPQEYIDDGEESEKLNENRQQKMLSDEDQEKLKLPIGGESQDEDDEEALKLSDVGELEEENDDSLLNSVGAMSLFAPNEEDLDELEDENLTVPSIGQSSNIGDNDDKDQIRVSPVSAFDDKQRRKAIKKAINRKYKGRLRRARGFGNKPIRKLASGLTRTALKTAGMSVAGTIGLAAGISSGKGVSGATQGALAGGIAGNMIGQNAYNLGAKFGNGVVKREIAEHKATKAVKRERELEKIEATEGKLAAIKYARDNLTKEQKKRYNEILNNYQIKTGETLKNKKDIYKDIYDYETSGVLDESKIIKGLQLEHSIDYKDLRNKVGNISHDNVVDVMSLTNKYGEDVFLDEKVSKKFENKLDEKGFNNEQKDKVKDLLGAALDVDNRQLEKTQKIKRAKMEAEQEKARQKEERRQARLIAKSIKEMQEKQNDNNDVE